MISLFFMLGCIPPMLWLNTAGRRPLLIGSFAMMTLALAVLGLIPDMGIWLVVMAFAVYAFFSGGPGNLQWLYPNELFPTDIRALCRGRDYVLKPYWHYCIDLGTADLYQ